MKLFRDGQHGCSRRVKRRCRCIWACEITCIHSSLTQVGTKVVQAVGAHLSIDGWNEVTARMRSTGTANKPTSCWLIQVGIAGESECLFPGRGFTSATRLMEDTDVVLSLLGTRFRCAAVGVSAPSPNSSRKQPDILTWIDSGTVQVHSCARHRSKRPSVPVPTFFTCCLKLTRGEKWSASGACSST